MMLHVTLVKKSLPRLVAKLRTGGDLAEKLTAREIATKARARAPVRTGKLRRSIRQRDNEVVTPVPYARYQEYGTRKMEANPFFFEATDGVMPHFTARVRAVFKGFH